MERPSALSLALLAAKDALPVVRATLRTVRSAADEIATTALGPDFEERLRRVHIAADASGVDPFGLDPEWAKYAVATAAFFYRFYFRAETFGIDRLPPGRVLLVSNHSGQIPFDGLMIGASLFLEAEPPRIMRSMVEKWTQTLPFVSTTYARLGQVVGVPENARRLLDQGEALVVFPEGGQRHLQELHRSIQARRVRPWILAPGPRDAHPDRPCRGCGGGGAIHLPRQPPQGGQAIANAHIPCGAAALDPRDAAPVARQVSALLWRADDVRGRRGRRRRGD